MVVLLVVSLGYTCDLEATAKSRKSAGRRGSSAARSSRSKASRGAKAGRSSRGRSRHVSSSRRGRRGHAVASRHRKSRHAHVHHVHKRAPRYAYDPDMFLMKAPDFDQSPLPYDQSSEIMRSFTNGTADQYPARMLVRAGVIKYHPMRGGIYWRREKVKHLIMHSTETGIPVSAVRVIESWSSGGRRHPGAQFVVDRDGTIYQAADPDLATVHINIFKTLPGINNDNSIGIEMNHTGRQEYPEAQLTAVHRLVNYLQARYNITDENIITHRYAQQGDHTDPVAFDWSGFLWRKNRMRAEALAYKAKDIERNSNNWRPEAVVTDVTDVPPTTILQPHTIIRGVPDPTSPNRGFSTQPTPVPVSAPGPVAAPVPVAAPLTPSTLTVPAQTPQAPAVVTPAPAPTPSVFGVPAPPVTPPAIAAPIPTAAPMAPPTAAPQTPATVTIPAAVTTPTTIPASPVPTFNTSPGASTIPAPSTSIFAAPQRLGPNGHPMPVLRGPIEVAPTHAGDVNAAPQQ